MEPGSGPWTENGQYGANGTYMIQPRRISSGPVWVKSDVERFAEEIGRQRAPVRDPDAA